MFQNYEISKLSIPDPVLNNLIILCLLLGMSALRLKKSGSGFLDRIQTGQLKGLAIVLVVLGHLRVHVSEHPAPTYASYAVALFLFLSGFGLTMSSLKKKLGVREFFVRRLSRVMVPYWMITLIILIADYLILGRTYSLR